MTQLICLDASFIIRYLTNIDTQFKQRSPLIKTFAIETKLATRLLTQATF